MQKSQESLRDHIAKFIGKEDLDFAGIFEYFTAISVDKKKNLLNEGKICRDNYFVNKGCLRMFFINERGVEQTIQFALENWWLSDYTSFSSQKPSDYYIQAVEKSEVLTLNHSSQDKMLKQFPQMERYFRIMHQRAHAASQFRIKSLYELSSEQRYYQFSDRYPEFVQRIPQYLLASYLDLTPEYLSEIKSKRFS
ncbi:MAG: Crp/Fnr family transcriptional regulator [Sphingobacteriales bacterium]|nr:MAG: Crp/Fnr family transcriptional regulator [Sphingobacteriales bacterium]